MAEGGEGIPPIIGSMDVTQPTATNEVKPPTPDEIAAHQSKPEQVIVNLRNRVEPPIN